MDESEDDSLVAAACEGCAVSRARRKPNSTFSRCDQRLDDHADVIHGKADHQQITLRCIDDLLQHLTCVPERRVGSVGTCPNQLDSLLLALKGLGGRR